MYRVIIVDDEPLLLRNIAKSIAMADSRFEVVLQATDGAEALAFLQNEPVDVVFTDMRMPVITGLELIEKLRGAGYNRDIVILSGYDDFEYARQGLRFGVTDYLLKPIDQEALAKLLAAIVEKHCSENEEKRVRALNALLNPIDRPVPNGDELAARFAGFSWFKASLLCIGSYCVFDSQVMTFPHVFWSSTHLDDALQELKGDYTCWLIPYMQRNLRALVIAGEGQPPSDDRLEQHLFKKLQDNNTPPVTIAVGRSIANIADLSYSCLHSSIVLRKTLIYGVSSIFNVSMFTRKNADEAMLHKISRELIVQAIEASDRERLKKSLADILDTCRKHRISQSRLEHLLNEIVSLFVPFSPQLQPDYWVEVRMEIDELVSNTYHYAALADGFNNLVDAIFYSLQLDKDSSGDHNTIVARFAEYLDAHYYEQVSLNELAREFGLVLPYLSSIFKKQYGLSPKKYLVQLRIDNAKKALVNNSSIPIKEIARMVGYDNPYFMSRIFKAVVGCSPTEYRNDPTAAGKETSIL